MCGPEDSSCQFSADSQLKWSESRVKMTIIKNWTVKLVVSKKDGSGHLKAKFSKCSKLKRAISHKILRKTSNKQILEKNNKSSVLLVSIRKSEKESIQGKTVTSQTKAADKYHEIFLPPLDLVIEEAKHELLLEKLCDKEMKKFEDEKYSDNCSSQSTEEEEEDIYEEMEVLQSYFQSIYSSDYLEMGLI